jgi:hypothetical protein
MTDHAGFIGYDAKGHFIHFCWCGQEASFGYGVSLRTCNLGVWFCREHRPKPADEPKPLDPPLPAQGELF